MVGSSLRQAACVCWFEDFGGSGQRLSPVFFNLEVFELGKLWEMMAWGVEAQLQRWGVARGSSREERHAAEVGWGADPYGSGRPLLKGDGTGPFSE